MALPLDVRDLMSSGAKLRAEREKPLRIAVFVDVEAPDAAVDALKEALRPQMSTARIHVEPVTPGDVLIVDDLADIVVALTSPGATLARSLKESRDRFVPTALLALGETRDAVARRLSHPVLDTLAAEKPEDLLAALGRWLSDRLEGKRVALAANFEFVRRAVAEEAVKNTAFQNAVIGGVAIIPGADMPLMTANQAKMVLQIAAAYGQPLDAGRIKELGAVVGGAFVLRSVARQVLTLIPGFGWAIKAGIGYTGTLAMGYGAIEYFEGGGDADGLAEKMREIRERVVSKAAGMRGRGEAEVIPAHAWVAEEGVAAADPALPAAPGPSVATVETGEL
ncbi:MAG: hypothetical protein FDZ75_02025 [Actinobacteria bacterium]|nr:MAG: hypothetical protein FDZ75_02025 [Actinomycetota bacterium]